MRTPKTPHLIACCLPLLAIACQKSGAEAQREAEKAQAEAQTKITNAEVEQDKKTAEARADFAKTRADYKPDMETKLADTDKRIATLAARSEKATGKTKAKLDNQLPYARAERDAFARDLAQLDNETASTWDAAKARLDEEWKALKDAVDKAE